MTKIFRILFTANIVFGLLIPSVMLGQDINVKIGFTDSIKSKILQENRKVLIHLPDNYESDKLYPVMYRLDGDTDIMLESISVVNRLTYSDEITPEMIIVAIENTNRARDMWPVNNMYYPETEKAGAKDFLDFIEKELIPYIDNNYNTSQERIICGQSLSAIFTLYSFLSKPKLFNSYLICSVAFPDCEEFFSDLSIKAFQNVDQFSEQNIFITNGLNDPLDPDGKFHQQLIDFSNSVEIKLGNRVRYEYLTYENEGHVPFHSLYDGLKYIYQSNVKQ